MSSLSLSPSKKGNSRLLYNCDYNNNLQTTTTNYSTVRDLPQTWLNKPTRHTVATKYEYKYAPCYTPVRTMD